MRVFHHSSIVLALAFACVSIQFPSELRAASNGLAAVANGRPITKSEVDQLIFRQLRDIDTQVPPDQRARIKADLRKQALDTLIEVELILAEYYKLSEGKGVKEEYVDEEIRQDIKKDYDGNEKKFLADLKGQGISLKKYREMKEKMLIVSMMRQAKTKDSGFVSPERKKEFLIKHAEEFREKDKIKLRTITIPKISNDPLVTPEGQRSLAKEIRARVMSGGDFAGEARTHSQDGRASEGGDFGWVEYSKDSKLAPQLLEAAFKLKSKQVSEIIESSDAFYLFYAEERQLGKSKPKAEVDAAVEQMVILEQRKKSLEEWVGRLKSKANIRVY